MDENKQLLSIDVESIWGEDREGSPPAHSSELRSLPFTPPPPITCSSLSGPTKISNRLFRILYLMLTNMDRVKEKDFHFLIHM